MANAFNQKKNCDEKTTKIVNGYIRKIQKLFPWQENFYFIIPELINHICLSFYWIRFKFNKTYIGDNLEFINDTTVTKTKTGVHELCALQDAISGEMCDIFQVEYCVKNEIGFYCPYIGFLKLKSIDASSKISWHNSPGYVPNESVSVGIAILNETRCDEISMLDESGYEFTDIKLKNNAKLKNYDRIMLEFDFTKSECYIYHNDNQLDCIIKLDSSHIIPCVSLYFKGEVVEIIKYEFIFNKT